MDKYLIQPQSGIRIDVNKGQRIEIIDVDSGQMADFFYQNGADHPNCLDNINHALGIERTIIQPINFFMNTLINPNGKIEIKKLLSKAGDKIVLTALVDCILGISACSVSECATNSGNCTAIAVNIQ